MATYTETVESIKAKLIQYFGESTPVTPPEVVEQSTAEIGNIYIFSYVINDIFEEVKKITSIKAKTIRDKEGKLMIDLVTMTNDEKSLFDTFLKNATNSIFDVLSNYSKLVSPALLCDEGNEDSKGKVFFIIDYDVDYKDAKLKLIDLKIFKSMVDFILAEWYRITGINDLYASYESDFISDKEGLVGDMANIKMRYLKCGPF